MKWIYFFTSVLIGIEGLTQSIVQLDEKNGFQQFTINKELSAVQDSLEFLKVFGNEHAKLFKVKDPVTVNGISGVTELVFYKDKLVEISIFFKKATVVNYDSMKRTLVQQFGDPEDQSKSKKKPAHLSKKDRVYTWKGKKLGLQLNYDVSHKMIEMLYWGLDEATEKIKEEF
jgi:hypothetical protein